MLLDESEHLSGCRHHACGDELHDVPCRLFNSIKDLQLELIDCRIKLLDVTTKVILHGVRHVFCSTLAFLGGVLDGLQCVRVLSEGTGCTVRAFLQACHDGGKLAVMRLTCNGFGKVRLLLCAQVVPYAPAAFQDGGKVIHIALFVIDMHTVFCQLRGTPFGVSSQTCHDSRQACTGLTTLDTSVSHCHQHCSGILHRVPKGTGGSCYVLVSLTELLNVRVTVRHGICHLVNKTAGILSLKAECCQIVRHDVRCPGKVHVACCSQIQDTVDTLQHILCIPSGKSHVTECVRYIRSGKDGAGTKVPCGLLQLFHLFSSGSGKSLDVTHTGGKINAGVNHAPGKLLEFINALLKSVAGKIRNDMIQDAPSTIGRCLSVPSGILQCVVNLSQLGLVLLQFTVKVINLGSQFLSFLGAGALFKCYVPVFVLEPFQLRLLLSDLGLELFQWSLSLLLCSCLLLQFLSALVKLILQVLLFCLCLRQLGGPVLHFSTVLTIDGLGCFDFAG